LVGADYDSGADGMSLREYFAAKAMQGYLAGWATSPPGFQPRQMARFCFEIADAMILEREARRV